MIPPHKTSLAHAARVSRKTHNNEIKSHNAKAQGHNHNAKAQGRKDAKKLF